MEVKTKMKYELILDARSITVVKNARLEHVMLL